VIKCVCGIGLEVPHIISVGHHMLKIYFRTFFNLTCALRVLFLRTILDGIIQRRRSGKVYILTGGS
jgi:hypothetical protein